MSHSGPRLAPRACRAEVPDYPIRCRCAAQRGGLRKRRPSPSHAIPLSHRHAASQPSLSATTLCFKRAFLCFCWPKINYPGSKPTRPNQASQPSAWRGAARGQAVPYCKTLHQTEHASRQGGQGGPGRVEDYAHGQTRPKEKELEVGNISRTMFSEPSLIGFSL